MNNNNNNNNNANDANKRLGVSGLSTSERLEQLKKNAANNTSNNNNNNNANKFIGGTANTAGSRSAGSILNRTNSPTSPLAPKTTTPATSSAATQRLEQMKLNTENAKKNIMATPKSDPVSSLIKNDVNSGNSRSSGRSSVAFLKMQELREKERQKRLLRMSKRQSKRASKVQLNSKLTDFLTIMQKIETQFQAISTERVKMEEDAVEMRKKIELLEAQLQQYKALETFSSTQIDALKSSGATMLRQPNYQANLSTLKTKIDSFADTRSQKLKQIESAPTSPSPLSALPPAPSFANNSNSPSHPRMGGSLLDQIQKGTELKKVETNAKTGFSDSLFQSLHDTIQLALDIRKKAMEDDDDSDSDEDEEEDWFASEEKFQAAVNTLGNM